MTPESNNRVYWHRWFPSSENGMPVERCRCGVMRNLDGSNDRCLCSAAMLKGYANDWMDRSSNTNNLDFPYDSYGG